MRAKNQFIFLALFTAGLTVTSCNLPVSQLNLIDPTAIALTAQAVLAEAAAASTDSAELEPTNPAETPTPVVIMNTSSPQAGDQSVTNTVAMVENCDRAAPGVPLDVTVFDGDKFFPGSSFTKIWRLTNRGSCSWDSNYAVVHFSGSDFAAATEQYFSKTISPGQSVDIVVDMVAPNTPGSYSSYWMLRNPEGKYFGIGPDGNSPFWVMIEVVEVSTPTALPTTTPTATPSIYSSGTQRLSLEMTFDLDSGSINQSQQDDDVQLVVSDDGKLKLNLINNSRLGLYGQDLPREVDCRGATLSDLPYTVESTVVNSYLCYRTSQGLPGYIKITNIDSGNQSIDFEFLTWLIP